MDESTTQSPDLDETAKYVTQLVLNAGADGLTEAEATQALLAIQNLFSAAALAELLDEGFITVGWDREAEDLRFFAAEDADDD